MIKRTTRFGVFPALNFLKLFTIVRFSDTSKFSFHFYRHFVFSKNGIRVLAALNFGRFLFLFEQPFSQGV